MHRLTACVLVSALVAAPAWAQPTAKKPAATAAKPQTAPPAKAVSGKTVIEPADVTCASPLGVGIKTQRSFCDVPIGRTSGDGILITLPPHKGTLVLTFDLHNRQTYSEEQAKTGRAYARLTATVGVMTLDNTLVTRAVVQNEFRFEADLFDRIGGGAGPSGMKAVAPTGLESIRVQLPEKVNEVCVLGERLTVRRVDADETFSAPGRPIALISNVMVEYTPQPARKAPAKKPPAPIKKK